jgi:hypothetical protein
MSKNVHDLPQAQPSQLLQRLLIAVEWDRVQDGIGYYHAKHGKDSREKVADCHSRCGMNGRLKSFQGPGLSRTSWSLSSADLILLWPALAVRLEPDT